MFLILFLLLILVYFFYVFVLNSFHELFLILYH